ncbi:redox-sensing transcriptional repressor Rex [Saccharopolyspora sp. TS4A08]|uniref:Redox-sensing transcriptional repressor Rex n=1 Tax=Saccharopolyspora ipomoeae TaxID=3042027 RepID=A0ABT6PT72_9PSEU|nr:redox-sensing transcriptional repressor Rex [Saccharopolyspora sp. TS4A08]MDI2031199.1 redox-sensing transcriptional repressor Rex [Saccharopolyspora sp. TS4A08]
MTAQGADVPEGDGQSSARTAASPRTPDADATDAAGTNGSQNNGDQTTGDQTNGAAIEVPAARERARSIPEAAVARLAVYLRALSSLAEQDITTVSSEELATAAGVNSAKLRKDLSYIGSYGTRGVGYEVEVLIGQIERTLGLTRKHSVAVVGIGNLGHALANYGGFPGRGFPVSALFDLDDDLVGVPVGGIPVSHIDDIVDVCSQREVTIGVIATPTQGAQEVCDRLVAGGVTCILNFAPVVLQVPEHVEVRKVDLAVEMQILSFHVARRQQEAAASGEAASGQVASGQVNGAGPPGGGAGLPGEIDSANRMVERL